VTTPLVSPPETIYDQEGAVLASAPSAPPLLPPSLVNPIVSPENFTDFQTPQGGSSMSFG
jgi:hypothetical protein